MADNPVGPPVVESGGGVPDWLGPLIAAAVPIAGRVISGGGGSGAGGGIPPELQQLLGQSVQRTQYQNPLFQAVTNQAFQGLPSYAREGMAMGPGLPAQAPMPMTGGGGSGGGFDPLSALAGAGLGSGATFGFGKLADLLKKLFGRNGGGFLPGERNQPGTPLLPGNPYNPFENPVDPSIWGPDPTNLGAVDPGMFPPNGSNVTTDQFMGQWPETTDPFAPFDPSMVPGGGGGIDELDAMGGTIPRW